VRRIDARGAVAALACILAGCGGHGHSGTTATRPDASTIGTTATRPDASTIGTTASAPAGTTTTTAAAPVGRVQPKLTGEHPCPGIAGFTCATLSVPLDHAGQAHRTLRLNVGAAASGPTPKGVLLFLTGGPGQPGVPFIPRIESRLGAVLDGYRLVMLDQRGTGSGALLCPALQAAAGSSDLAIVPPGMVAACARRLGPDRRYFTTSETVADIDELRQALGVDRLTVDGVSYGTFVAERYALSYPRRVARLVLDSVVPQQGVDPLDLAALQASARVLRSVCRRQRCGWDPASDLAAVVRTRHDGPQVVNAIVAESIVLPSFPGILTAIHAAAAGRPAGLTRFLKAVAVGEAAPASLLSQGLHESTVCLELGPPWDPRSPAAARAAAVARTSRLPPRAFYPFDRATATGNGLVRGCLEWPSTEPPALPAGNPLGPLPRVPILLLSGRRDLSTPPAWAREEAAHAPGGQLVAVAGAGHSVQLRARNPAVRRMLSRFLDR
jgi:pimeloyl-ACP methyl ester carboxylesterase